MKKLLTVIVMVMVLVGVSVVTVNAGVKTVKLNDLKPHLSSSVYHQTPSTIRSSDAASVSFCAEVKLPVGKTIKKLTYYHQGSSFPWTRVILYRSKTGQEDETIANIDSYDDTAEIKPIETREIAFGKIKRGYIYWVYAMSHNSSSQIRGIEITY